MLVIPPGMLPIPADKGGAIETLATYILDMNEMEEDYLDIDVINKTCSIDERSDLKYRHAKILCFRQKKFVRWLYTAFYKSIRAVSCRRIYLPDYYIFCINQFIRKNYYDIILVEGEYLQGLTIKKPLNTRLILHLHTDLLHKQSLRGEAAVKTYDKIICVSDYIKSRVKEIDERESGKCEVLYNCVDEEEFVLEDSTVSRIALKEKLHIPSDSKVISFCGRMSVEKGFIHLLRAFLSIEREDLYLLAIGSNWFGENKTNPYIRELNAVAQKSKYGNHVIFTGYIPHRNLKPYMESSDIIVVPSICEEAASLVVLEAMCSGVPVIASRKGGIPEYMEREAGIFVDVDDCFEDHLRQAIMELIDNEEFYHSCKNYLCNNFNREKYSRMAMYMNFKRLIL